VQQQNSQTILKNKTHLHWHGADEKKTTTKNIQSHNPTSDYSKVRVACMENPEEQIHVLSQDYGAVPLVVTSAL
jgi:hypothetical protein